MSVKEKMIALADEIRAKTGKEEAMSLDAMAENIQEVYDSGAKSEYDAFWDKYQQNGKRENYNYAFNGSGWNDTTFKPKYDIVFVSAGNIMTGVFNECLITNLSDILKTQNISIDCSKYIGSNPVNLFYRCLYLEQVPLINVPTTANYGAHFYGCAKLHTIEGMVLSNNGTQSFGDTMFYNCISLKNITITGKIGNDFDIHWSPLTKDSILSIFTALSDTAIEKTVSFSLSAVNKAFETAEGAVDGSISYEWNELLSTKANWTVVLM